LGFAEKFRNCPELPRIDPHLAAVGAICTNHAMNNDSLKQADDATASTNHFARLASVVITEADCSDQESSAR
jgi:hypothetical protein